MGIEFQFWWKDNHQSAVKPIGVCKYMIYKIILKIRGFIPLFSIIIRGPIGKI